MQSNFKNWVNQINPNHVWINSDGTNDGTNTPCQDQPGQYTFYPYTETKKDYDFSDINSYWNVMQTQKEINFRDALSRIFGQLMDKKWNALHIDPKNPDIKKIDEDINVIIKDLPIEELNDLVSQTIRGIAVLEVEKVSWFEKECWDFILKREFLDGIQKKKKDPEVSTTEGIYSYFPEIIKAPK